MMTMPWSWKRSSGSVAVIGGTADVLAWLHADAGAARGLRAGGLLERRADEGPAEFARRVRGLGLPPRATSALLPGDASQLVQIAAPKVAVEEMRAAARWQVKDLVKGQLDELTIDVMPVGDGREQRDPHLFVAAAPSALISQRVELAAAAGLEIAVVDIVEAAQRNLQLALAEAEGLDAKSAATAALTRQGGQALLTVCAAGELFYARRLEGLDARREAPVAAARPEPALAADLESAAIVDYGAPDAGEAGEPGSSDDEAPLVIELQRSLDVWERTWREMPVARLWVELGDDSAGWIPRLQAALGVPVARPDAERVWPGFDRLAPTAAEREALLPLAGALLRHATRTP
jgi:MSHA biogenesis protein MshI